MDVNEILDALNKILDLGDSLDGTGVVGVKALTNGRHTSRETIRLELSKFLLYIANGNCTLDDGETALINIVLDDHLTASELKKVAAAMDVPDPSSCLTLMGFLSGDMKWSQLKGCRTTTFTNSLITAFEAFGHLMVAFDENSVSQARCDKYINGMKSYVLKNFR